MPLLRLYGGGPIGKTVEQMSMERGRQAVYNRLPIMREIRKLRVEIEPVIVEGEEVWPGKTIGSVDLMRKDIKLLHYQDVEKMPQAVGRIFHEHIVIGIEDLLDPRMYDNFTDIIIRFGKITWLVDVGEHKKGDCWLWITVINVAERIMRIYFDDELIYDSETVPVKWKHTIWELKQVV